MYSAGIDTLKATIFSTLILRNWSIAMKLQLGRRVFQMLTGMRNIPLFLYFMASSHFITVISW